MSVYPQGLIAREGEVEGLALILRALTGPRDSAPAYDDFCACLGVSVAGVAVRGDVPPQAWPTYGRDLFLEQVARAWGLSLRNLHPPDVGVDMARAEEFDQHFELSYKPLIRRALEHDQPVIAWRGWEEETIPSWGIVTEIVDEVFAGYTALTGQKTRLTASSWQCYVLESNDHSEPSLDLVLHMALRHGTAMLSGESKNTASQVPYKDGVDHGVALGLSAWSVWCECLFGGETMRDSGSARCPTSGDGAFASYLLQCRSSLVRFWERVVSHRESRASGSLRGVLKCCDQSRCVIERIVRSIGFEGSGTSTPMTGDLIELLDEARRADESLLDAYGAATQADC